MFLIVLRSFYHCRSLWSLILSHGTGFDNVGLGIIRSVAIKQNAKGTGVVDERDGRMNRDSYLIVIAK